VWKKENFFQITMSVVPYKTSTCGFLVGKKLLRWKYKILEDSNFAGFRKISILQTHAWQLLAVHLILIEDQWCQYHQLVNEHFYSAYKFSVHQLLFHKYSNAESSNFQPFSSPQTIGTLLNIWRNLVNQNIADLRILREPGKN